MVEVARYTIRGRLRIDTKDADRALLRLATVQRAQAAVQARMVGLRAEALATTASLAGAAGMAQRIRRDVSAARQEANTIRRWLGGGATAAAAGGGPARARGGAGGAVAAGLLGDRGLGGLVGAYVGFQGARSAGRAVLGGVGIANSYEMAEASIRSLLMTIDQIPIHAAKADAGRIFNTLRDDAAKSVGGLKDFLGVYQTIFAPGRAAGASDDRLRKLTRQTVAAGYLFGGGAPDAAQTAGRDVLQALTQGVGERVTPILFQVLRAAGFKGGAEEFNTLSQEDRLMVIEDAFDTLGPAVEDLAKTFQARKDTLIDAIDQLSASFGRSAIQHIGESIEDFIATITRDNEELFALANAAGDAAGKLAVLASNGLQWLVDLLARLGGVGQLGQGENRAANIATLIQHSRSGMATVPNTGASPLPSDMAGAQTAAWNQRNLNQIAINHLRYELDRVKAEGAGSSDPRRRFIFRALGIAESRMQSLTEGEAAADAIVNDKDRRAARFAALQRTIGTDILEGIDFDRLSINDTKPIQIDGLEVIGKVPDKPPEPIEVSLKLSADMRWGEDRSVASALREPLQALLTEVANRSRGAALALDGV